MSLSILKAGALALGYVGTARAAQSYTLSTADTYAGENFFDLWDFFTGADPTAGFVKYQSQAVAAGTSFGSELIKTYDNGSVYIGVDHTNTVVNADGHGRASIRIESKASYTHGLFIADIAHMPDNTCGSWPAFWTYSNVNYPAQGEIDILENINELTDNLYTLHTTDSCTLAGNAAGVIEQSATQVSYNCADTAVTGPYEPFQYVNQGCSATSTVANSYGNSFNANGGGVYAMEWTSDFIKIWNFGPQNTPPDIASGKPDPTGWGTPSFSTVGGVCDIDSRFKEHSMVFDTTFCGNYAGQDQFWQATSCYSSKYPTCNSYVAANPSAFVNSYWLINSVKVYQLTNVVASSSTTVSSTTSSTTSTAATITTSSSTTPIVSTTSTPATSATDPPATSSSATSTGVAGGVSGGTSLTSGVSSTAPYGNSTTGATSRSKCSSIFPTGGSKTTSKTVGTGSISLPGTSTSANGGVATTSSTPVGTGGVTSSGSADAGTTVYTTSVVTSTRTLTTTSCAATVTNCPAGAATTYVTTYVDVYTTVCPVTATEGSGGAITTSKAATSGGVATSSKAATSGGVATSNKPISSAAGGVVTSKSAAASLTSGTTTIHKTTTLLTTVPAISKAISSAKASASTEAAVSSAIYTTAKSNSTVAVGSGTGAKTTVKSTAAATSGNATTSPILPVTASSAESLRTGGFLTVVFALVVGMAVFV